MFLEAFGRASRGCVRARWILQILEQLASRTLGQRDRHLLFGKAQIVGGNQFALAHAIHVGGDRLADEMCRKEIQTMTNKLAPTLVELSMAEGE
jgi:hypothetical protein